MASPGKWHCANCVDALAFPIMSKVDECRQGEGYLSYSGRPQSVPFFYDSLQLLDTAIPPRNG